MSLSAVELLRAKEAVAGLLETLGVEAYLFEVEPDEAHWQVRIECALGDREAGGWQSVTLAVEPARLLASRSDAAVRTALLDEWRARLAECRLA